MKSTILFTVLALLLFSSTLSFGQESIPQGGIHTPGTTYSYKMLKAEPVCWTNEANEFSAYIPGTPPHVINAAK